MPYRRRRNGGVGSGSGDGAEDGGGVKGPSSALTSFLREQGINAEQIRLRYEKQKKAEEEGGEELQESEDVEVKEEEDTAAPIEVNFALDSDEEELDGDEDSGSKIKRHKHSDDASDGGSIYCIECDEFFTVSVYSKKMEKYGKIGYLCPSCTKLKVRSDRLKKRKEIEQRKLRKKIAAALLNKQQFKVPTLQDFCIHKITENIENYKNFDNKEISSYNKNKISRILAKNRSLNNRTMELFLDSKTKDLEFWDCSKIDKNALDKIPAYCPNLENLTLNMCGQLHNDNLKYFGSKFGSLKSISLNGAFLVNEENWQLFFESKVGKNLQHFHLRNTHRFTNDCLVSLLENCGKNLKSLTLNRLDGLDSKAVYDLLPHFLDSLEYLEISSPHNENLIDDDLIINLLALNCETLSVLNLDKCSGLTNKFLIEGLKLFGSKITDLSLNDLDQIDTDGFNELFKGWKINSGLVNVCLERCIALNDESVYLLLEHSKDSLTHLNLNSVKNLSKDLFIKISRSILLPHLTNLDIGFVRSVDDSVLSILSRIAPKLKILEVYGNNRCTEKALVRSDLAVIGRQSDSI